MYDDAAQLHFIGHCSSFSEADRTAMLGRFSALETDASFGEEARKPEPGTPLVGAGGRPTGCPYSQSW